MSFFMFPSSGDVQCSTVWVRLSALSFIRWVNVDEHLSYSEPQFPHL